MKKLVLYRVFYDRSFWEKGRPPFNEQFCLSMDSGESLSQIAFAHIEWDIPVDIGLRYCFGSKPLVEAWGDAWLKPPLNSNNLYLHFPFNCHGN